MRLSSHRDSIAAVVRVACLAALLLAVASCGDDPVDPGTGKPPAGGPPVAAVVISPPSAIVGQGASLTLTATAVDSTGATLSGRTITWSSSNTAAVTVNPTTGSVTGVGIGSASITATSEGKTATTAIIVMPPVATVTVTGTSSSMIAHSGMQLKATLKDAAGNELTGRAVTWSTSSSSAATVDASGFVTAIDAGSVTITATSEGRTGTLALTVTADQILPSSIAATEWSSCGLTTAGKAYCWGVGGYLGVSPDPIERSPVEVAGGRTYQALAAGVNHTLGLTTDGEVYAWGQNWAYQLGNTGPTSLAPTKVGIPGVVKTISAFETANVALTTTGAVYVWGTLIHATTVPVATTPTLISGLPSDIAKVASASGAQFAITSTGEAWGWGESGWTGDGTDTRHPTTPVRVAGNLKFAHIAGGPSNIGITTDGKAYNWGVNSVWGRPIPTTQSQWAPGLISGGQTYSHASGGVQFSLLHATTGEVYGLGVNIHGVMGAVVPDQSIAETPTLLFGGKKFAAIQAGGEHYIGVLSDGNLNGGGRSDGNQTGAGNTISNSDVQEPKPQAPPSYQVSPAATTLSIQQGGTKSVVLTIRGLDGGFSRGGLLKYRGTVSLAVTQSTPGVTVTLSPSSVTLGTEATVLATVSVASSTPVSNGTTGAFITATPQIDGVAQQASITVNVTSPPPPGGGGYTCTSESSAVAAGYQCVTYSGKTTLVKYAIPELVGTWVDRSAGVCFNWGDDGKATVRYQGGGLLGGAARTTPSGKWGALATSNGGYYPNPTQWYIYTAEADDQTKLLGYDSGTKQIVGWSFTKSSCPW